MISPWSGSYLLLYRRTALATAFLRTLLCGVAETSGEFLLGNGRFPSWQRTVGVAGRGGAPQAQRLNKTTGKEKRSSCSSTMNTLFNQLLRLLP